MAGKLKLQSPTLQNTENSKENELSPTQMSPHLSPHFSPHFLLSRRESKKSMLDGLLLEKQVRNAS